MKNIFCPILLILFLLIVNKTSFSQNPVRDTTMFKEHQVLFEQMDYIPYIKELKLKRILKNDTAYLIVNGDPYWISCLVSNKDYDEYLKSLKSDSTIDVYNSTLPSPELHSIHIEELDITFSEYLENNKYDNYPVLGISWKQANRFCKWKTSLVNFELQKANLPKEKIFRLPKQAEIEHSKKYTAINLPRIAKIDSTFDSKSLSRFNASINEWTGEAYIADTYLKEISVENSPEHVVVYNKNGKANAFEHNRKASLNIGFRFVQTFRKVPDSE